MIGMGRVHTTRQAVVKRLRTRPLRRIFDVEPLECFRCGPTMRSVAFITEPQVIDRILDHFRRTAAARRRSRSGATTENFCDRRTLADRVEADATAGEDVPVPVRFLRGFHCRQPASPTHTLGQVGITRENVTLAFCIRNPDRFVLRRQRRA